MTTALTLTQQAQALQTDLKENLEQFFQQLPDVEFITNMNASLVKQSETIVVFRREGGEITVNDATAYKQADAQVKALKSVNEQFSEIIDPYVDKAFKLHRALTAIRKSYTQDAQTVITRLNSEMTAFYQESERLKREIAEREAEEARKREQERLLAEAAALADQGDKKASEEVLEEAVNVQAPAVVIQKTAPQVEGESYRSVWKFEILDKTLLKPEFLIPDEKAIGAVVKSMHLGALTLLGKQGAVKVWEDKTRVVR